MFVGGLKGCIKHAVINLKPRTLGQAFRYAKTQETNVIALLVEAKLSGISFSRNSVYNTSPASKNTFAIQKSNAFPSSSTNSSPTVNSKPRNLRPLSANDFEERKAKGLCLWCDEKYTPEHKCGKKRIYLLEGNYSEDSPEEQEPLTEEIEVQHINLVQEELPQMSLSAITSKAAYYTLKVQGKYGKRPLLILVDSGSTHNFLDSNVAKELNVNSEIVPTFQVSLADGKQIQGGEVCKSFNWEMQGQQSCDDTFLLPLTDYDLILGIQWLEPLKRILWDF